MHAHFTQHRNFTSTVQTHCIGKERASPMREQKCFKIQQRRENKLDIRRFYKPFIRYLQFHI